MNNEQKLKQALQELDALKSKIEGLMKSELEEGKWYRVKRGSSIQFNKSEGIGYGINELGTWVDNCRWMALGQHDKWREATPQEVEDALIEEAKRRGYVEGVSVIDLDDGKDVFFKKGGGYILSYTSNKLFAHGATVFKDGIWATIIEKPVDKFAELKEAHRNGAVIQFKSKLDGGWQDTDMNESHWHTSYEYRIKPEEKTTLDQDIKALKEKYPNLKFTITIEDNL